MKVYLTWVLFVFFVVLGTGLLIPSAWANRIASDPYTGCKVYLEDNALPNAGIIWKGACTKDKFATGDGILYWTLGGKVIDIMHHAKRGGLIMENGDNRIDIPEDAMTITFDKCDGADVMVRREVDVACIPVQNALINRVLEEYKSACAEKWQKKGFLSIWMYYQGHDNNDNYHESMGMVVYRNGKKEYHSLGFKSDHEQEIMEANQKIQAEVEQKRAAQESQRQKQVQHSSDQKVQAFANKYGATGWVDWEQLKSNPFSYEGKVLLFNTDFTRMITPTSGIFDNIVVSNLPRDVFTRPSKVMLAGKVLGTTNIRNQLGGEVSVPHVKYVGHIICSDSNCGGYFSGHVR